MGLFDKFKKSNNNEAQDLLEKHEKKELDDTTFLKQFSNAKVYYSTPFGDHKDGTKKVFLLPGPNDTAYCPLFASQDSIIKFYEAAGRVGYMIIEGTFKSALQTISSINNEHKAPIPMGAVVEPDSYGVMVYPETVDKVIKMI